MVWELNGKTHRGINVGINGPVSGSLGRSWNSSVQISGVGEWGRINRMVSGINWQVALTVIASVGEEQWVNGILNGGEREGQWESHR